MTKEPKSHIIKAFPNAESDIIEYKSAKGGFPNEFWKTYSAFANTSGGIIVLGVREKKGQFYFDGLDEAHIEKYKKEFWNSVNNRNTISINLLKEDDVKEYKYNERLFLIFNIPSANRTQKPVYLTPNPFKNTYKRNHEGDYLCDDNEVKRMYADADTSFSSDSRILKNYTFGDIDMSTLRQYRQLFASVRPNHTWLTLEDLPFLEMLGGYRKDRGTGEEGFTVAGLLMFGKSNSITDNECYPTFFPDYRECLSHNKEVRWSNRIYPDGTWESNLFQFYKLVNPELSSRLPKPFKLEKGRRIDETSAHVALREAFVNTLIHADYNAPGNIIIKSEIESFSFTNPGTLLVTLKQFYKGGISECRNPNLQKMFMMIGGAEKAGSGVSKILSGWEKNHWKRPRISIDFKPDRVVLNMPMFSTIPKETLEELVEIFGEKVRTIGMNELTALSICQIEGSITNKKLQSKIDLHKSDITKLLKKLCRQNYLVSNYKNRWTTYHINLRHKEISAKESQDWKELEERIIEACSKEYISLKEIAEQIGLPVGSLRNRSIIPKMIEKNLIVPLYEHKNHPRQKYKSI